MKKWLYKIINKKYQLSVVIPTYKNVEFLLECVNSVMVSAKKCCDFEILLGIDNCHETLKFVSQEPTFRKNNIKICYFPKNVGPYVIKNTLALEAKYDNILFFDSDDILMPDTIQVLMKIFEDIELLKFKFYNFQHGTDYTDASNLKLSDRFAQASFLIKKQTFQKMSGFFGWKCGADTEFTERYENQGNTTHFLDVPMYYRRYHDRNITKLPETGLNSKLRSRYGRIILDNRVNKKWINPIGLEVFNFNFINV